MKGLDHIEGWDAFGDADDEIDAGFGGFHDCVSGERGWDIDNGGVGASFVDCVGDGIEDGDPLVAGAAFAGGDTGDDIGTVVAHLECVEGAFFTGQTLHSKPGIAVNENAQDLYPPCFCLR
jgi:hypothetical protein